MSDIAPGTIVKWKPTMFEAELRNITSGILYGLVISIYNSKISPRNDLVEVYSFYHKRSIVLTRLQFTKV